MKRILGAILTIGALVGAGALFGVGLKCGEETGNDIVELIRKKRSAKKES